MIEVVLEYGFVILSMLCLPLALLLFGWWIYKPGKKILLIGLAALAVYVAGYARMQYAEFWLIDSCLDRGGIYNDQQKACLQHAAGNNEKAV